MRIVAATCVLLSSLMLNGCLTDEQIKRMGRSVGDSLVKHGSNPNAWKAPKFEIPQRKRCVVVGEDLRGRPLVDCN
jgi:hypothetical protein